MKKYRLIKIIQEEIKKVLVEVRIVAPSTSIFKTGWDIIEYFDTIPEFKKYRNKHASYDDEYFLIPMDVFKKVLPTWNKEKVEFLDDKLEMYEGSITWNETNTNHYNEYTISVLGGA